MYLYTGGEPTMRRKDLMRICRENPDCAFLSFTNGTLIDDSFADEIREVGNFYPAFSIEGYEEENDFRRRHFPKVHGCHEAAERSGRALWRLPVLHQQKHRCAGL